MRRLSYTVYIFLQCTLGIIQTLMGLCYFIISIKYPHEFYHGAVLTRRPGIGGVSLGLFIFANDDNSAGMSGKIAVHEFGHTIQSLILGPLYCLLIVPESMLWCALPPLRRFRQDRGISYYSFYTESWANKLGRAVLGEETP